MADVFVSYDSRDRARIVPLVKGLEDQGWSVWWDREIRPGASWDDSIEAEVNACGCVVVVWTKQSIESPWVKSEAMVGLEQGKLVPVLLDRVEPPMAFRRTQLADLTGGSFSRTEQFATFVAAVGEVLGRESQPIATRRLIPGERHRAFGLTAALTVIVIAMAVLGWQLGRDSESSQTPTPAPESLVDLTQPVPGFEGKPAIAVLPFRNLTPDAEGVSLSEGLSHDIANGLARFRGFPVISSTATQVYAGRGANVREAARDVGAGYVVTGDVRQTATGFRVNAEMTDADGRTIWSQSFEGSLDDFFSIQDDITEQIVGTTWPQYLRAEKSRAKRSHPANLTAWQSFVQGWELMFDSSRLREGEAHCRRAIELDPSFAFAHVCVGHAMGMQLIGSTEPDAVVREKLEEAFSYFERAREIDPFDANACACLVFWLTVMGRLDEGPGRSRVRADTESVQPRVAPRVRPVPARSRA